MRRAECVDEDFGEIETEAREDFGVVGFWVETYPGDEPFFFFSAAAIMLTVDWRNNENRDGIEENASLHLLLWDFTLNSLVQCSLLLV
jgi:hypothetical protein